MQDDSFDIFKSENLRFRCQGSPLLIIHSMDKIITSFTTKYIKYEIEFELCFVRYKRYEAQSNGIMDAAKKK